MEQARNFLSVYDFSAGETLELLARTSALKAGRYNKNSCLEGKKIGLIFEKSSTRTRVSFEVGVVELGGHPIFMSSRDLQLGRGEPVKDTARVLSRYLDGTVIRTFGQDRLENFAGYFGKPVINGLTDLYHPAQILTDIFTACEVKSISETGNLSLLDDPDKIGAMIREMKITYIGDANNMANSWVSLQALLGFGLVLGMPEGFTLDAGVVGAAEARGGNITLTHDKIKAAKGADIVTTDVFVSMGQEDDNGKTEKLKPFIVDEAVMSSAAKNASFLHCLPVHRGEEVSESVFERFSSVVFEEAENRLHVQKAIMERVFGNPR